VRPIAKWLLARPWNPVFALALSLVVPLAPVISGTCIVFLVLTVGVRKAVLQGAAAAALLATLTVLVGDSPLLLLRNIVAIWLPAVALAAVLQGSRSLSFAVQVSVIGAIVVTAGLHVIGGDPVTFWGDIVDRSHSALEGAGWNAETLALMQEYRDDIARQMTMMVVFLGWSTLVLVLVLGYGLQQSLPEQEVRYGRFSDLQLGRVLAFAMAIASMTALLVDANLLQDIAFVLFAAFWVQGMAMVHWLQSDGPLPVLAVVAVYVLLPFLHVLLIMTMAVLGYTDAWFNFRTRIAAGRK
jgi:hypothetical protein